MTIADVSSPSAGRDAPQNERTRPGDDVSSRPELPDDEESVTAAESDTALEQNTCSNGYTYGTVAQPPPPPKPVDDDA
ncbi:hypothetical protein LY76DRAFT_527556, partial [Colletotrichum caudatum]